MDKVIQCAKQILEQNNIFKITDRKKPAHFESAFFIRSIVRKILALYHVKVLANFCF